MMMMMTMIMQAPLASKLEGASNLSSDDNCCHTGNINHNTDNNNNNTDNNNNLDNKVNYNNIDNGSNFNGNNSSSSNNSLSNNNNNDDSNHVNHAAVGNRLPNGSCGGLEEGRQHGGVPCKLAGGGNSDEAFRKFPALCNTINNNVNNSLNNINKENDSNKSNINKDINIKSNSTQHSGGDDGEGDVVGVAKVEALSVSKCLVVKRERNCGDDNNEYTPGAVAEAVVAGGGGGGGDNGLNGVASRIDMDEDAVVEDKKTPRKKAKSRLQQEAVSPGDKKAKLACKLTPEKGSMRDGVECDVEVRGFPGMEVSAVVDVVTSNTPHKRTPCKSTRENLETGLVPQDVSLGWTRSHSRQQLTFASSECSVDLSRNNPLGEEEDKKESSGKRRRKSDKRLVGRGRIGGSRGKGRCVGSKKVNEDLEADLLDQDSPRDPPHSPPLPPLLPPIPKQLKRTTHPPPSDQFDSKK